jgi:hypothetical protein
VHSSGIILAVYLVDTVLRWVVIDRDGKDKRSNFIGEIFGGEKGL